MNVCRQQRLASLLRKAINARLRTSVRCMSDTPKDHTSQYAVELETDFENERWIARHRHMFDYLDVNKDEIITLDEIVEKASIDICQRMGATEEQTAAHVTAVENFFGGAGMEYGKEVEWPEYLEGWKELATNELKSWAANEPTLIRKWGDVIFDIIDTDKNGAISLEEWSNYTSVAFEPMENWNTERDAAATFKICDLNDDGKIEVDELTRQHVGFWYTMEPESDHLYGDGVP